MHHPSPRWLAAAFAGLFVLAGLSVAAWSVQLPFLAFSPGPIGDAAASVEIADSVPAFDVEGELYVLTVSSQGINPYELIVAAVDPSVDVVRRELVRREGETNEEYRIRQLQLMDQSQETAIRVALDRLDIDPAELARGAEVSATLPDAPAADVLEDGDVIEAVDGKRVVLVDDLREALAPMSPGDTVTLTVRRDGELIDVAVDLYAREDEPDRALIGILTTTSFPIDIDSSNVGGPSAGMMYTLAVMDILTGESLTKGNVIAGTGTIQEDGSVGAIGGVRQKVVAAEAAGARLMLVPESNYEAALTAPRNDLEIVAVATIDDAIRALEELPAPEV